MVEVVVVVTVIMVLMVDLVEEVQVVELLLTVELLHQINQIILGQEQQQHMEIVVEEDIIIPLIL